MLPFSPVYNYHMPSTAHHLKDMGHNEDH